MTDAQVAPAAAEPSWDVADLEPATTGPLTFGQLSAWRNASGLSRDRWHEANVFHTFELPAPVEPAPLRQALNRLQAKHESLRTVMTSPTRTCHGSRCWHHARSA